jgi:prepilin-type N-terminal cleavage/methylation domain-containing protein
MKRSAFTLIELLVVIAIIAILAAILFPVFAQAKVAAKQTQAISNLKNINTGFQIYMADYDDTWALWSSGMGCNTTLCPPRPGTSDGGIAFDLRFMYPSLVQPYIKNGVNTTTGALSEIWASPLAKPLLSSVSNTFAYNHWTLGGFSSCARTINLAQLPAVCVTRTTAAYAEFADLSYNFPASATSLANPAQTIAIHDGAQLSRPPQFRVANPDNTSVANIGVFGPGDPGNGNIYNPDGSLPTASSMGVRRLLSGNKTVVSYADSHVKVVQTSTLYHRDYRTDRWRGSATTNAGWSRDWGQ